MSTFNFRSPNYDHYNQDFKNFLKSHSYSTPRATIAAYLREPEDALPTFDVEKLVDRSVGPDCGDPLRKWCVSLLKAALTDDSQVTQGAVPVKVREAEEAFDELMAELFGQGFVEASNRLQSEMFNAATKQTDELGSGITENSEELEQWVNSTKVASDKLSGGMASYIGVEVKKFATAVDKGIPPELYPAAKLAGYLDDTDEAEIRRKSGMLLTVIDMALGAGDHDTFAKSMAVLRDLNPSAYRAVECVSGVQGMIISSQVEAIGRFLESSSGKGDSLDVYLFLGMVKLAGKGMSVKSLFSGMVIEDVHGGLTGTKYFSAHDPRMDMGFVDPLTMTGVAFGFIVTVLVAAYAVHTWEIEQRDKKTQEIRAAIEKLEEKISKTEDDGFRDFLKEKKEALDALASHENEQNMSLGKRDEAFDNLVNSKYENDEIKGPDSQGKSDAQMGSGESDKIPEKVDTYDQPASGTQLPQVPKSEEPAPGSEELGSPYVTREAAAAKEQEVLGDASGLEPADPLMQPPTHSPSDIAMTRADAETWIRSILDEPGWELHLYNMFVESMRELSREAQLEMKNRVKYSEDHKPEQDRPLALNPDWGNLYTYSPQLDSNCGSMDPVETDSTSVIGM